MKSGELREAEERFAGLCRAVGLAVWAGTTLPGLVLGLGYQPGKVDARWFGLTVAALGLAYLLLMPYAIWAHTGLRWHLLNAHAAWPALLVCAALLDLMLLGWITLSYPYLSLLALGFLAWLQRRLSLRPAEMERERFGLNWLTLGRLSFWNILLLRLPLCRPSL